MEYRTDNIIVNVDTPLSNRQEDVIRGVAHTIAIVTTLTDNELNYFCKLMLFVTMELARTRDMGVDNDKII